jgi:3-oxoacyl-[acyl-carrier-protein] synthase-1
MLQESRDLMAVESVGLVSSLGLNAESSCASVRAGISRFEEILFHDSEGIPIIGAPAVEAVVDRQGYRRLASMIAMVIQECVSTHYESENYSIGKIPVLINLDSLDRPDYSEELPDLLSAELSDILGKDFPKTMAIYPNGKTGFFHSLLKVRELIKKPDVKGCIIASGDSLLNAQALSWLENNDRLKKEDNSDGVIPGEAAAALWIGRAYRHRKAMMYIGGIALANEEADIQKDEPNLAIGLAEAMKKALAETGAAIHEIDFRIGGMTGERLEFMEASTALARIQRIHKEDFDLFVPAEYLGDVGAALPACMMVTASIGFTKGYAPGSSAILFSSSRSKERAACVISKSNEK